MVEAGRELKAELGRELLVEDSGGDLTTKGSASDGDSDLEAGSATLRREGARAKGLLGLSDMESCDGRRTKGDCLSVPSIGDDEGCVPFVGDDMVMTGDAARTVEGVFEPGDSGLLKGDCRGEKDIVRM